MPKFSINSVLLLSTRSYSAAVENARVQPVVTALRKATDQSGSAAVAAATDRKEIFWMRDPKSGNWIPESHFDEIDVVQLREKFLPQKFKQ